MLLMFINFFVGGGEESQETKHKDNLSDSSSDSSDSEWTEESVKVESTIYPNKSKRKSEPALTEPTKKSAKFDNFSVVQD